MVIIIFIFGYITNTKYLFQITKLNIEEKLLHEEIELKWEDVMNYVKDFQALQKYRSDMFVGVVSANINIYFIEMF